MRLMPTLIAILIVELILVACMFIPYSSNAIPSWNVLVTDENGRAVAGALVKQSAAFSGLEEKNGWKLDGQIGRVEPAFQIGPFTPL
jgi:hypothetical protein